MSSRFFLFLACTFVFFSFLKPSGFDHFGYNSINAFFNISRIICAIIIGILYIKRHRHNKLIRYLLIYFFLCMVAEYMGIGDANKLLIFSGSVIAFTMLFDIVNNKNLKIIITSLLFVYMVVIVYSFFILYNVVGFTINIEEHFNGEELERAYFLSSSNGSASFLVPAMLLSVLNLYISGKNNLLSWITIGFSYCSGLIIWSATALVAETFLLLYAVLYYFNITKILIRKFNHSLLVLVCLIISLSITFFKIQYLFEYIIVDILHKDLTMTGRTDVWNNGFNAFKNSPLFGLGYNNSFVRTCDNCYAQLLGDSGLVGCLAFAALMLYSYKYLKRVKYGNVSSLFFVMYALLLLMFVAESWCNFFGLYVLLVLFSKADVIQNYIDSVNNKD